VRVAVLHWGRTGGGPRFACDLVAGLAGKNEVFFSVNSSIEHFDTRTAPAWWVQRVRTYRRAAGVVFMAPRSIVYAYKFRRLVARHKIDVVISAMESIHQSLLVPRMLPRSVAYIAVIHDGRYHPGEGHYIQSLGRQQETARADGFIFLTESVAKNFMLGTPNRGKPSLVLPLPPARPLAVLPRFAPVEGAGDLPVVGFFGRLAPYKGIHLLLQSMAILRARGVEVQCVIFGAGPESRWRQSELGKQAIWHVRWINEEEIDAVIASFDILAVPYIEASQSGVISLAEAWGVPVVATPVGGLSEQVANLANGHLSGDVTPEAFAAALQEAIQLMRSRKVRDVTDVVVQGDLQWREFAEEVLSFAEGVLRAAPVSA